MDETNELNSKPEEKSESVTSLPRTIISLLFFAVLYYWLFDSWTVVIALIVVLLIHESGHFIAMKIFGYKGVNMTFVPFVGAYVSGEATNLSNRNKLIVLLAGPLPGIIIGIALLLICHLHPNHTLFLFAITFLLQNTFNLLPVFPLDGGQVLQTLFFTGSRVIQLAFLYLSMAVLVYLFFKMDYSWGFLLIAFLVFYRIGRINLVNKVREKLDEEGVDYACSYDDLTDEEYWQIRNAIVSSSKVLARKYEMDKVADNEQQMIKYVENVLRPAYNDDLGITDKILFMFIWITAFAAPILLWYWYKGML